ncbi:cell wall-binding repeat-containing protein [Clostridium sp. JNZ X4-2]
MLSKKNITTLLIVAIIIFLKPTAIKAESQSAATTRLFGVDRYSTNMKVADYGWTGHSDYAIIVSGENFPDAVCSAPLSVKYNAPLLMTAGNTLSTDVQDKLTNLGVKKVFLIGGTGVISSEVENELTQKNIDVQRLGGSTRIETSIEIAKQIGGNELFLVSSEGFADALSISPYASSKAAPLVLTTSSGVPEAVKDYVDTVRPSKTYIIGGQGVIPDNTASYFGEYERLGGQDRYETNAEVISKLYNISNIQKIYIAAGINYPDALSISPLAARDSSPVVLVDDNMSQNQVRMIRSSRNTLKERVIAGGESVVPDYLINRLFVDSDDITPADFINSYNGQVSSDELTAFKNIVLGLSVYPNDCSLKSAFDNGASHLLDTAVKIHNQGNYDAALNIYNYLLQLQVPEEIKVNATVYKNVALSKNPIISKYVYKESSEAIVQNALEEYSKFNFNFDNPIEYTAMGEYLNFSANNRFTTNKPDSLTFDENGIPMVTYREFGIQYNFVTICQYALYLHARYLQGDTSVINQFVKCADFLVSHMDSDGSFRYKFPYYSYESLGSNWTSSMAQGQALNVFSRAYEMTGDKKYITAGNKAFDYLITPISQGGVMDTLGSLEPRFKSDIFFQEYVNTIPTYTLNGYMFTLLGIYDWSQLAKQLPSAINGSQADYYFSEGIKSLKIVLPYYDIGGFTSYDLSHLMTSRDANPALDYHKVHIDLLEAIYSITKDEYFMNIRNQWVDYIKF